MRIGKVLLANDRTDFIIRGCSSSVANDDTRVEFWGVIGAGAFSVRAVLSRPYPRKFKNSKFGRSGKTADDLHKLIYEVKGTVNWLSSARIASQGNHSRPGALRLTRLVDTFYIQCNFDGLKTKSKKHKVG